MIVIGLTGSIGMGKSTLAMQLQSLGAKVCSADAIVHQLMGKGGKAVAAIGELFQGVVKDGAVDRKALGAIVFNDKEQLKRLEQLLHPLVVAAENTFVWQQRCLGARMAVLDIPLLFETGADQRCDVTMVVSAPHFLQRQRVLKRAGMSEEKFKLILRTQMPDRDKRRRADRLVLTGLGKSHSMKTLKTWIQEAGL
jgi:dephospho-CoA kinase